VHVQTVGLLNQTIARARRLKKGRGREECGLKLVLVISYLGVF
jgi:hypothetical protein